LLGGILLIIGTSIGGGMLALPVANAATGFWQSSVFLILCWIVMTLGAFCILEANLYLPRGKHMVSMAAATLGRFGLLAAWLSYLFLLYTLLAAYISGGSDVLNSILLQCGLRLADWQASFLFTVLFGLIVYGGICYVGFFNCFVIFGDRGVMRLKRMHPIVRHILMGKHYYYFAAPVCPEIEPYHCIAILNLAFVSCDGTIHNRVDKVISNNLGSLIPLICYLAWDAVIMGSLPSEGTHNLEHLMHDPHTTSSLAMMLSARVQNTTITTLFNFFTSICMLTAFLGVSLCLYSFLADGLKLREYGRHGLGLFVLTFAPPLLLVIYWPGIYINALAYAGIFCIILLLLLPALMCYFGRKKFSSSYRVPGGNKVFLSIIIISLLLLAHELYHLM